MVTFLNGLYRRKAGAKGLLRAVTLISQVRLSFVSGSLAFQKSVTFRKANIVLFVYTRPVEFTRMGVSGVLLKLGVMGPKSCTKPVTFPPFVAL